MRSNDYWMIGIFLTKSGIITEINHSKRGGRKHLMKRKVGYFGILLSAGMLMGSGGLSALEIGNDADAVKAAGKLRMLTWRALKDYIEIGMKSTYGHPKEEIKQTFAEFDENLKALKIYVKDPLVKRKLNTIEEKWQNAKVFLNKEPELAEASKYFGNTKALKKIIYETVGMMSRNKGAVIEKSSRLPAVSQALSAIYSLKSWGMKDADKALAVPMRRFRETLDFLEKSPETEPKMAEILQKMEKVYLFFQVMNDAETLTPSLAIKRANEILKDAERLTELYANALKH